MSDHTEPTDVAHAFRLELLDLVGHRVRIFMTARVLEIQVAGVLRVEDTPRGLLALVLADGDEDHWVAIDPDCLFDARWTEWQGSMEMQARGREGFDTGDPLDEGLDEIGVWVRPCDPR